MTTSLKALEAAIKVESMDPSSEEEGDEFTHAWFEFQEKYGREARMVTLEAARKYLSIQKAVEAGTWKLVPTNPSKEACNAGMRAWDKSTEDNRQLAREGKEFKYIPGGMYNTIYKAMLQSAPEFTGE